MYNVTSLGGKRMGLLPLFRFYCFLPPSTKLASGYFFGIQTDLVSFVRIRFKSFVLVLLVLSVSTSWRNILVNQAHSRMENRRFVA